MDPDLGQTEVTHLRRGRAWAGAGVAAWAAMAVVALTVGRPEITAVQHYMQRTTGVSAFPPLVPAGVPASGSPAFPGPSQGPAGSGTARDRTISRGGSAPVPRARRPAVTGVSARSSAPYGSPTASAPSHGGTPAPHPTFPVPTTLPTAVPTSLPTSVPTAFPTYTDTPTPTSPSPTSPSSTYTDTPTPRPTTTPPTGTPSTAGSYVPATPSPDPSHSPATPSAAPS